MISKIRYVKSKVAKNRILYFFRNIFCASEIVLMKNLEFDMISFISSYNRVTEMLVSRKRWLRLCIWHTCTQRNVHGVVYCPVRHLAHVFFIRLFRQSQKETFFHIPLKMSQHRRKTKIWFLTLNTRITKLQKNHLHHLIKIASAIFLYSARYNTPTLVNLRGSSCSLRYNIALNFKTSQRMMHQNLHVITKPIITTRNREKRAVQE